MKKIGEALLNYGLIVAGIFSAAFITTNALSDVQGGLVKKAIYH